MSITVYVVGDAGVGKTALVASVFGSERVRFLCVFLCAADFALVLQSPMTSHGPMTIVETRRASDVRLSDRSSVLLCFNVMTAGALKDVSALATQLCFVPFIVCGTHADLRDGKRVFCFSTTEGTKAAKELGAVKYLDLSATKGRNCAEAFDLAAKTASAFVASAVPAVASSVAVRPVPTAPNVLPAPLPPPAAAALVAAIVELDTPSHHGQHHRCGIEHHAVLLNSVPAQLRGKAASIDEWLHKADEEFRRFAPIFVGTGDCIRVLSASLTFLQRSHSATAFGGGYVPVLSLHASA